MCIIFTPSKGRHASLSFACYRQRGRAGGRLMVMMWRRASGLLTGERLPLDEHANAMPMIARFRVAASGGMISRREVSDASPR